MKNTMQLKAIIKNLAKEKNISAQLIMQNFMLERLLERISVSAYKSNFILKGGFLIAAMVGLDSRATMDMDVTLKDVMLSEKNIKDIFDDLCKVELNDGVEFVLNSIKEIRENDEYNGFRISLLANYPPMSVPLKLDITTGDKITPKEIEYKFKLLLEDRDISILAYNLETVLSEKLETILSRGDLNTRPRDFYDVYILVKLQSANIDVKRLKNAVLATFEKRESLHLLKDYNKILHMIEMSEVMRRHWSNYQKDFGYAMDISFSMCCNSILDILEKCLDKSEVSMV